MCAAATDAKMIGKLLLLTTLALSQGDVIEPESTLVASDLCPAQGHYLLPHEYDCTKFYYCEYGKKWETARDCSPGTEFSYALQVCIHPGLSGCTLPGTPPPATEEPTEAPTEAPTQTPVPIITTEAPTEAPTQTPVPIITTEAPTEPPTQTPVPIITTEAPTEPPTQTPVPIITTEAPTEPPTQTPVPIITTEAPTEPSTQTPVSTITTEAPTEPPTQTPVPTITTEAPTEPPTQTPVPIITTEAPTEPPTQTPVPIITTEAPTEPSTQTPVSTITTEAPTEPPTQTPVPIITTEAPTEKPDPELLPNGCPADFEKHLLLPHETNCNKFYYCVFGEKVERECAPGTHFNPAIQVCDWPEDAGCVNSGASNENSEASEEVTSSEGSGEVTSSEGSGEVTSSEDIEGSGEIDIPDSEVLANGCPADFNIHQLLPHESDCAKFYYCVYGDKVERDCGPGTHFNPVLQVCDWPQNAGCENAGSGESNENNSESDNNTEVDNGSGDNGSGDNGSGDNGVLPNGCPADFDVHQLLPHESDCAKFYYCVDGEKVERDCGPGTLFNPTLQVCDWPANVNCSNSNSGEDNGSGDNGSGDNGSGDNGSGDNGSGDNGNGDDGVLPNGCPADFDVHQLLPHQSDCAKFYYCVHGEKVERDCGPGTHFNPALQVCDWPQNAGCANAGSNENSGEENGSGDNGSGDTGSGDTGSGDNGSGDNNSEVDNGNSNENGVLDNGCPAEFNVHQLLPHESDCAKFYYCVHGEKVERDCGPGTHFNPTLQVCDWPQNAGCAVGSGENGNSEEGSGSNENGNSEEGSGSNENGNEIPSEKCEKSCNIGAWAHEHDCDKFWRCEGGNAVLGVCSEGLHFNVQSQTCDFICNAGCVRDDVQSTPEHDGLKLFLPWDKVDNTIRKLYLTGQK